MSVEAFAGNNHRQKSNFYVHSIPCIHWTLSKICKCSSLHCAFAQVMPVSVLLICLECCSCAGWDLFLVQVYITRAEPILFMSKRTQCTLAHAICRIDYAICRIGLWCHWLGKLHSRKAGFTISSGVYYPFLKGTLNGPRLQ